MKRAGRSPEQRPTDCTAEQPDKRATYHAGGEVVGTDTNRAGNRIDIYRCRDCGMVWEAEQ